MAGDPVLRCQVKKGKAAGKRAVCLAKERAKELKGKAFDTGMCEDKFDAAIAKADARAAEKGVECRFVDNGDETVSDLDNLTMWEKKVFGVSASRDSQGVGDCLHCAGDTYRFTEVFEWLSALNGRTDDSDSQSGFAGYTDWRLATVGELQTILDLTAGFCGGGFGACIDPSLGPTVPGFHWSSTSLATPPSNTWFVNFGNGDLLIGTKFGVVEVRAVRGGR